jgi:hypothetical protein
MYVIYRKKHFEWNKKMTPPTTTDLNGISKGGLPTILIVALIAIAFA